MKRTLILVSILTMVISSYDVGAQSIRSMIRRKIIEDNLEAQAERDSVKAVEEGREPERSPRTMDEVYLDAFGLTGNVDYENSYAFDAYIKMEVSEFDKNEQLEEKVLYDSYMSRDGVDYAMVFSDGNDRSTIIFDSRNAAMLILTDSDGEKTGMAMGMDPEDFNEEMEDAGEEPVSDAYAPYKTGKSKNILGYKCDEYLVEDESSRASMWVSEELGKEVRREILNNQQTFGALFYHAAYLNGMVMEYDLLDKEENTRSLMVITDVDLNRSHSISTRNYTVISMKTPPAEEEEEE